MATIGNYKVIKQIGEGGFARTYLAEHAVLGAKACLKQNLVISPEDEEMLLREARLLWRVHHHSLPTVRDFIRLADGSYVMAMTFVEGKELAQIVEQDYPGGIDPEHVCWMARRLLTALQYLHYHGIIHGDIQPQNIIVQVREHNAVLVDYGLATFRPRAGTSTVGYTVAFAAPEQVDGKPPIPETDLYCLGATLFFALSGKLAGAPYPERVPVKLREFVNRLIVRDPLRRPRAAGDLVKPLSELRLELFGRASTPEDLAVS